MTTRVLSRLLWKEQQAQRSFWLSMAVLTAVLELLAALLVKGDHPFAKWLSTYVLLAPSFYVAGCAAVSFAGEKESGTFRFLASMPVSSSSVFAAKLLFAVISSVVFYVVLITVSLLSTGNVFPSTSDHALLLTSSILCWLQMLVWGLFFALLSAHTLRSALRAIVTTSLFLNLAYVYSARGGWDPGALAGEFSWLLVTAGVLFAVDAFLGARWTHERATESAVSRCRAFLTKASTLVPRRSAAVAWRLTWQQWRDARATLLLLMLVYVCSAVAIGYVNDWQHWTSLGLAGATTILATSVGSLVFLTDQRERQRRFLVEHGVSPWQLWISRHVLGGLLTVVLAGAAALFHLTTLTPDRLSIAVGFAATVITGYAVGQLCSMLIRSPLLSTVGALVLLAALAEWIWLSVALRIPVWVGIAPVPVALFTASRIQCYDWMREQTTWHTRCRLALFGFTAAVAILGSVSIYRVLEIPHVELPRALRGPFPRLTAQQQKQWEVVIEAANSLLPPLNEAPKDHRFAYDNRPLLFYAPLDRPLLPPERVWLYSNADVLQDLTVLNNEIDPAVQVALAHHSEHTDLRWLATLVVLSARQLEADGQLERALERYLLAMQVPDGDSSRVYSWRSLVLERLRTWSAAKGQSPALLRRAAERLKSTENQLPLLGENLLHESAAEWSAFLKEHTTPAPPYRNGKTLPLLRWMPGERIRAWRIVQLVIATEQIELEQLGAGRSLRDAQAAARARTPMPPEEELSHWTMTTPTLAATDLNEVFTSEVCTRVILTQRMTRVVMGLQAARLDQGRYPESLDELVPRYLPAIPPNPHNGTPIHYCRTGIDSLSRDLSRKLEYELRVGDSLDTPVIYVPTTHGRFLVVTLPHVAP